MAGSRPKRNIKSKITLSTNTKKRKRDDTNDSTLEDQTPEKQGRAEPEAKEESQAQPMAVDSDIESENAGQSEPHSNPNAALYLQTHQQITETLGRRARSTKGFISALKNFSDKHGPINSEIDKFITQQQSKDLAKAQIILGNDACLLQLIITQFYSTNQQVRRRIISCLEGAQQLSTFNHDLNNDILLFDKGTALVEALSRTYDQNKSKGTTPADTKRANSTSTASGLSATPLNESQSRLNTNISHSNSSGSKTTSAFSSYAPQSPRWFTQSNSNTSSQSQQSDQIDVDAWIKSVLKT